MSYTKQTWETGDVITAEKLNHMEDGIGGTSGAGEILIIHVTYDNTGTFLDKTWQEIFDAMYEDGKICYVYDQYTDNNATYFNLDMVTGVFNMYVSAETIQYSIVAKSQYNTDSPNDYPFIPYD